MLAIFIDVHSIVIGKVPTNPAEYFPAKYMYEQATADYFSAAGRETHVQLVRKELDGFLLKMYARINLPRRS